MPEQYYLGSTSLLLEKTRGVLVDSAPPQELLDLLPVADEELSALRQGFNESVSLETPDARQFCQPSIETVHSCFDDYIKILREIEGYGRTFNITLLRGTTLKIDEADKKLHQAFLAFRNDVMIARGPSSHGGLNLIINYLQRILYGEDVTGEFMQEIQNEFSLTRQIIATIDTLEQNVFNRGSRTFYGGYQQLLQQLASALQSRDGETLARLLTDLQNLGDYYKHFDVNFLARLYSRSPTPLPLANLVMNTANNFVHGMGERDVFNYFLDQLRQVFNKVRYRYDEVTARMKPSTEAEREEAEFISKTLKDFAQALQFFEDLLENPDENYFLKCWDSLGTAAISFAQSVKALETLAEDSGKVICFNCGFRNVAGEISCRQCKAVLPQVEDKRTQVLNALEDEGITTQQEEQETQMTVYINKLFETAAGLAQGTVPATEFERVLADMDNRLQFIRRSAKPVPQVTPDMVSKMGPENADKLKFILEEAAASYREGLDDFIIGISKFHEFSNSLSVKSMEAAKDTVWKGVKKLQKAQALIKREFKVKEIGRDN